MTSILIALATLGWGSFLGSLVYRKYSERHKYRTFYSRIDDLKKQLSSQKEVAEKYKKIAKTHEITFPSSTKDKVEKVIELDYSGTIQDNLDNLKNDLEKYKDDRVYVGVNVWVLGAWKKHLTDSGWTGMDGNLGLWQSLSSFNQTSFYGSNSKVMKEFETLLKDPTYKFWNYEVKDWYGPNAPICFKVSIFGKPTIEQPKINTVYVEVLVEEPKDNTDVLLRQAEEEVERLGFERRFNLRETQ